MAKSSSIYVGMDVHKDSIDIALAEAGGVRGNEYSHLYADSWAQNIWAEMLG